MAYVVLWCGVVRVCLLPRNKTLRYTISVYASDNRKAAAIVQVMYIGIQQRAVDKEFSFAYFSFSVLLTVIIIVIILSTPVGKAHTVNSRD